MKCFALLGALISFVPFALAQSEQFEDPYAVEQDGVLQAILWRSRGGHRILLDDGKSEGFQKMTFNISLFGNDPFFDKLLRSRKSASYQTMRIGQLRSAQGSGDQLPQASTVGGAARTGFKASKITFGGGTTRVDRVQSGATVECDVLGVEPDKMTVTREMVSAVKRQKLWTCSNFRVSLAGSVLDSVISFEPIELFYVPGGYLDGDGAPDDEYLTGKSFAFEVPKASAAPFQEMLNASRAGTPKELPLTVEYLDGDGSAILTLRMVVTVGGVGPMNIFADPAAASNNVRVWTKIKKDLAIEMERRSGGF